LDWPPDPFWDYSLELYRRPGVEAACLDLQRRHGVDVNLVLLCCWLASRGVALDRDLLAGIAAAVAGWQAEVIGPLRALRRRLKAKLADPDPGSVPARWPELGSRLCERLLDLEIDGEHLEQLRLAQLVADRPASGESGVALASANLRVYWSFLGQDRHALVALLRAAFPRAAAGDVARLLDWLDD
jgi:uncharacterized protein (TIGR02444 family)